jgi:hypothetical protein
MFDYLMRLTFSLHLFEMHVFVRLGILPSNKIRESKFKTWVQLLEIVKCEQCLTFNEDAGPVVLQCHGHVSKDVTVGN